MDALRNFKPDSIVVARFGNVKAGNTPTLIVVCNYIKLQNTVILSLAYL